jgi:hypothetical protein
MERQYQKMEKEKLQHISASHEDGGCTIEQWFQRHLRDTRRLSITHPRHQNAAQNHDLKIANRCFENVAQFKYLGATLTNQNQIQKEIKRRLNSGSACYLSVQKLSSSRLPSKISKLEYTKG